MNVVRVMIVEDSPTVLEFLRNAVDADPRLTVVSACASAEQALESLHRTAPDVISMDIHLSQMSGLEATRRIMETRPTPIVIVSRSVTSEVDSTLEALRVGAVSAIEKPTFRSTSCDLAAAAKLCRELAIMSEVKVIRQRFNGSRSRHAASIPAPSPAAARRGVMVGVVASTGGPRAVETLLCSLGAEFPLPVAVVQHITSDFHNGFVSWLDRVTPQAVVEAEPGMTPSPGHVYIAPADRHLAVRDDLLTVERTPPENGHRPSGNVLLRSMAESLGDRAIGVVLTGMGDDGAEGLCAIRHAGGYTITEHESTAIVNGMPEAARVCGASCVSLPLDLIGPSLATVCSKSRRVEA